MYGYCTGNMSVSHLNALPKARTLQSTVQGGPGAETPRSFSFSRVQRVALRSQQISNMGLAPR
jgi:hypothetical protein